MDKETSETQTSGTENDTAKDTAREKSEEFAPIESVSFISPETHGVKRSVGADIQPNGDLVISGLDWGPLAQSMLGGDYEYSVTIEARYKDSVLLLLLQQQFEDFAPAKEWLEKAGVPFKEWRWS